MKLANLYAVTKQDTAKVRRILVECFQEDPLYAKLIPDLQERHRVMPEVMECDAEEMLDICDVYADGEEVNSVIIVDDDTQAYNAFSYYSKEAFYQFKMDAFLIKEDIKALWNFWLGRKYLNAAWTRALHYDQHMHLVYFAVRPKCQGTGLAGKMIHPVLRYADENGIYVSLETHNPQNLPMYEHYGFTLHSVLESHLGLKQYCMVRKPNMIDKAYSE